MTAKEGTGAVRAVRDRPMIFSALMVRALLEGQKRQTRRALKPQPFYDARGLLWWHWSEWSGAACNDPIGAVSDAWYEHLPFRVGDCLWVKEATRRAPDMWVYEADGAEVPWPGRQAMATWTRDAGAATYLPCAASRLTLIVEAVKVERLASISCADAIDEGALAFDLPTEGPPTERGKPPLGQSPKARFAALWDSIHGPDAWNANPWVAAISFRTTPRNIDCLRDTPPLTTAKNRAAADQDRGGGL